MDLVQQDLQLSSDRSDSENPEGINNTADSMTGGSGPMEDLTRVESGTQPPPETPFHPPGETVLDHPPDGVPTVPLVEVATEPIPAKTVDAGQQPVETMNPDPNQVVLNPTAGVIPEPLVIPPALGPNTTGIALVPTETEQAPPAPPGFPQQHMAPVPSLTQVVPLGLNKDQGALRTEITDRSMGLSCPGPSSYSSQW